MHKIVATLILGAMFAAAQTTAAELLQKGIYAQETAGDLDGAIKIYRQIVDSHPAQREIGAQAQYRLGLTLLAKGDANNASQEIQRLGWDFPDYKELIASANSASDPHPQVVFVTKPGEQAVRYTLQRDPIQPPSIFDLSHPTTVTGTVTQIRMNNPNAVLTIDLPNNSASPVGIFVSSPSAMAAQGWKADTLKIGDQVTVVGAAAHNDSSLMQATSVSANGVVLWSKGLEPKDAGGKNYIVTGGRAYVDQTPNHDAEFDFSKSMTLTGTVLQVQWLNPYAWLTVDAASPGDSSHPYLISLDSPVVLMASGWSRDTVKVGGRVTVTGAPARDSSVTLQATSVSSNGAVLFTHAAAAK